MAALKRGYRSNRTPKKGVIGVIGVPKSILAISATLKRGKVILKNTKTPITRPLVNARVKVTK